MLKRIAPALLAGLLAVPAHAEEEQGWWYGGTLTGTTDYVYRGVSQTDESPALQGSLDVGHSNGLYAGIWASNVDFDEPDGIDYELNLYVGWVYDFTEDTSLDVHVVRYLYPGANAGYSFNYNELIAALSFLDYFTATVAYSDDWLNTDEHAFYYHLGADIPLGIWDLNLKLGAGLNDISRATGSDYRDFQVGFNRSWGAVNADLSYFETNGFNGPVQEYLGPRGWATGRVVLTLSMEF